MDVLRQVKLVMSLDNVSIPFDGWSSISLAQFGCPRGRSRRIGGVTRSLGASSRIIPTETEVLTEKEIMQRLLIGQIEQSNSNENYRDGIDRRTSTAIRQVTMIRPQSLIRSVRNLPLSSPTRYQLQTTPPVHYATPASICSLQH